MRSMTIGVSAAALFWSACAAAQTSGAKSMRTVELITMSAKPARGDLPRPEPISDAAEIAGDAMLRAEFRVHDLSRRWVEFQMTNSFKGSDLPEIENAPAERTGLSSTPGDFFSAAPSISVPLWMRGGTAFASAATRFEPGCAALPYRRSGFLKSDAEMRRASYYQIMSSIACEYGIPVALFDAMIIRESRYRIGAVSPKSAFGLTQLMPGTAAELGVNRYSVEGNLRGGAKYLRRQLDTFGHYHLALAAYNAGPGRVRGGKIPPIAETQNYVDNVLSNWSRLSGINRQPIILSQQSGDAEALAPAPRGRWTSVSLF